MTPQEIAAWYDEQDAKRSDGTPHITMRGNLYYRSGVFYAPYIPLQWIACISTIESAGPTWLDKLKQWDFEAYQLEQEENKMALTEFEKRLKEKEQDRSALLQDIARLEGKMSTTTKVDQTQVYDLLNIVRTLVERA